MPNTVRKTSLAVAIFFALALAFNGEAMLRSAEKLEYGGVRDFWTVVLKPLAKFSHFTRLGLLRSLPERTAGAVLNGED